MKRNHVFALIVLLICVGAGVFLWFLHTTDIAVLNPKGLIAEKERDLFIVATTLMLIVVIPVFILIFVFAWEYRAGNTKAKYSPNWNHSHLAEALWWGVPFLIIVVLGVITWKSSHELDPFKPLDSQVKPLKIQVVALQWKWLFIYPEEKIATINFIQFPEKTPIDFEITADAPMNSFWIPQLGGQIYAMPGMKTELHLIANETGNFRGSSSNFSGRGFSGMHFIAKSSSQEDFQKWVKSAKKSARRLSQEEYERLSIPSENQPVSLYVLGDSQLFERIITQYMPSNTR